MTDYKALLQNPNVKAFLHTIRVGEGTADDDGYRRMFTGKMFDDFSQHPNIVNRSGSLSSTAAGAYQFLKRTWDECQQALSLPDFSPASQDLAALFLIERRGALQDVIEGRLSAAISKCNREWASLPGSTYGQPTRTLAQATQTYRSAGGTIVTVEGEVMLPFVAAALPALIQAAPALIRVFGEGKRAEQNAKAAEVVAEIAKKATGEATVEGAVNAISSDPEKAAAYREAVHENMNSLLDAAERMSKIDEASVQAGRDYNVAEPLFFDTEWLKIKFVHLLSMVFVAFSGAFAWRYWPELTPELKGAVMTLMVIAGWNGVRDYWMGSSNGSERKTDLLRKQQQ